MSRWPFYFASSRSSNIRIFGALIWLQPCTRLINYHSKVLSIGLPRLLLDYLGFIRALFAVWAAKLHALFVRLFDYGVGGAAIYAQPDYLCLSEVRLRFSGLLAICVSTAGSKCCGD